PGGQSRAEYARQGGGPDGAGQGGQGSRVPAADVRPSDQGHRRGSREGLSARERTARCAARRPGRIPARAAPAVRAQATIETWPVFKSWAPRGAARSPARAPPAVRAQATIETWRVFKS